MSPTNFKNHVSPHEVLQSLILASKGKFKITERTDCVKFLSWFLNTVHSYLKCSGDRSVISEAFQGELEVEVLSEAKGLEDKPFILKDEKELISLNGIPYYRETKRQKFLYDILT